MDFEYTLDPIYIEVEYAYEITVEVEEPVYELQAEAEQWVNMDSWGVEKNEVQVPWTGYLVQDGEKYDMDFDNFQIGADWSLWGSGSDSFGEFTMYGYCDDQGHCEFTKEYIGAHSVFYKGEFNGKRIRGKWNIPGQLPEYFEIKMEPQNWQGAFWADGEKYPMALDLMVNVPQGVYGSGCDDVGSFTCSGGADTQNVWFAKRYLGQHTVNYYGQWMDDENIEGSWRIGSTGQSGRFRLVLKGQEVSEPVNYVLEDDDPVWADYESWGTQKNDVKIPWSGYLIQDGERYDMRFDNFQIAADWSLWGGGADDFGEFVMYGTCDGTGVCEFTKEYIGAHSVIYNGQFDGKVIRGTWYIEGQNPEEFMIKMQPQTWRGAFWADGEKCDMKLDMTINETGVYGNGSDEIGFFTCAGGTGGGNVWFAKRYLGQHTVHYYGEWKNGKMVKGKWRIFESGQSAKFVLRMQ